MDMSTLDTMRAQIAACDDVESSALKLINGLAEKLDQCRKAPDPFTEVGHLMDHLRESNEALAAAVVANTEVDSGDSEARANLPPPPADGTAAVGGV